MQKLAKLCMVPLRMVNDLKESSCLKHQLLLTLRQPLRTLWSLRNLEAELPGLDGRPLHVRSLHSALNLLLQSAGALICKKWILLLEENLINLGLDHGADFQYMAWVHDEVQVACRTKEIAETVIKVAQESMRQTQEFFGFRVQLDTEGKVGKNWADCH